MNTVKKTNYRSIGQMLIKNDFEAIHEEICRLIKTNEIENLLKPKDGSVFTELDDILFALPDFAVKKEENNEIVENRRTGELFPMVKEVVRLLLGLNANPNVLYDDAETAFLKACKMNSPELLKTFLGHPENSANINSQDGENKNALYYAIMYDAEKNLRFLIDSCGLNPHEKNFLIYNQTPIYFACKFGAENCFDVLMDKSVSLNIYDLNGQRPIDTMLLGYDKDTILNLEPTEKEKEFWGRFTQKVREKMDEQADANPSKKKYRTSF